MRNHTIICQIFRMQLKNMLEKMAVMSLKNLQVTVLVLSYMKIHQFQIMDLLELNRIFPLLDKKLVE